MLYNWFGWSEQLFNEVDIVHLFPTGYIDDGNGLISEIQRLFRIVSFWFNRLRTEALRQPRYDKVSTKVGGKAPNMAELFKGLYKSEYTVEKEMFTGQKLVQMA